MHTISTVDVSYDPFKDAKNVATRGLSFCRAAEFDFGTAKVWQDLRRGYGEARFVAIGYLAARLHVLVFSETASGIRVISFRKANSREGVRHGFPLTRD